jgi:predicted nucleotide-binding protein (sugar kinase/HSP70/actin superfamily)
MAPFKLRIHFCILLQEIDKIEKKLDNKHFGLEEIKKEIETILTKVDLILDRHDDSCECKSILTTGPVVTDTCANLLIVKVLNNRHCHCPEPKSISVTVFNLKPCPKQVWDSRCLIISSKCAKLELIPITINNIRLEEYEVQFSGITPGIFACTSTILLPGNNLSAANTFRHSELVPQIDT